MYQLNPDVAKRIIDIVGANGIPPEYGFQYFTVGLEPYLSVINKEYFSSFIKQGGSAFKLVVGAYGGGKTHFLYCLRDYAWKHNFVVSYVSLSPGDCPFHKLDLVYSAIVKNMMPPLSESEILSGYEKGIVSFLRSWFTIKQKEFDDKDLSKEESNNEMLEYIKHLEGIESISFINAIKSAYNQLLLKNDEGFKNICQWLLGEGYLGKIHKNYGILQKIDRTTAFPMIRSLLRWIREIGYSGLIILFDEAERVPSLSTKQKEMHLSNLREIIDECGHANFQGTMFFYAVPDENFFEGRTQIYEALKQRLTTVFNELNPTGVKIELEKVVYNQLDFLKNIGLKLKNIYETAYNITFKEEDVEKTIDMIANYALEQRFGDIGYKRLFVQKCIFGFEFLRQQGNIPSNEDLTG